MNDGSGGIHTWAFHTRRGMKCGSGEIHTWSFHRRVPAQMAPPSLRTVQLTVVFSPEKFCGCDWIDTTRRSAAGVAIWVVAVAVLLSTRVSRCVSHQSVITVT